MPTPATETDPTFKASFTVTIEMTEAQHAAYAERYGVGFAGMEVTNRARQATANALDEAPWMQGLATFKVGKMRSAESPWHENWADAGRDSDGNLLLEYKPAGAAYRVLPVEET